jgi:hypothetical protein
MSGHGLVDEPSLAVATADMAEAFSPANGGDRTCALLVRCPAPAAFLRLYW